MKSTDPVVLITGSARRVGAVMIRHFHAEGYRVLVHFRRSESDAIALSENLNQERPESAAILQGTLDDQQSCDTLLKAAIKQWGRLDVLVNNASDYFPTTLGKTTETEWETLFQSNLKAPYFLVQAALPHLQQSQGNIVNIIDIHAEKPLKGFDVYCSAKAGLRMLTQSLAKTLAPTIRVNGVAPGATLWPENKSEVNTEIQETILSRTPLKKLVDPNDIAKAVLFCVENQSLTGEIIRVDCGRSLQM